MNGNDITKKNTYQHYYDNKAGLTLLSFIARDLSLLGDPQIKLNEKDFYGETHRLLFQTLLTAHNSGVEKADIVTLEQVANELTVTGAKWEDIKNSKGLLEALLNSTLEDENIKYFYNRVKKSSLVRQMAEAGMDMDWIYPSDKILDPEEKSRIEEFYQSLDLKQLSARIEDHFLTVRDGILDSKSTISSTHKIQDGLDELVARLGEEPDMGAPLYGKYINTITRGARLGKLYLWSAPSGVGKAIPNDTKIPTLNGWKTVGEIIEGDYLFDRKGNPTKVLKVFPQPKKLQVWEVTLKDGRKIECCEDHLWTYWYKAHRGWAQRTETTKELLERANRTNGFQEKQGGYKYKLPMNEAVQYLEKDLSIPPYSMGALLGDGSLRYDKTNKALTVSSDTPEIPNKIAKELNLTAVKNSNYNYSYSFKKNKGDSHNYWVEEIFANYPELWNAKSEDKFIPGEYLQGSIEQRVELFKGLMDTDGSIDNKGRLSFTTVSPFLRDNFIELCYSLGFTTSYSIDKREEKYTTGECYNIHIQAPKNMKPKLFSLQRKVKIATDYANSIKREERKDTLPIAGIEPTNRFSDMTCFLVDNEEHLFQVGDFIVTHNTRAMMANACVSAMSSYYDLQKGKWVSTGPAEPTLFISTELSTEELQTMAIAFISGVNEDHILSANFAFGDEKERIAQAVEIIKKSKLIIEELPNYNSSAIEQIIKKSYYKNHCKMIFFDYLGTSLGVLEEMKTRTGTNLREDSVLFLIATRLKEIANEYNIFIMTATQLNAAYKTDPIPDQSLLRGAKSIADRIDMGMILLNTTKEDKEILSEICPADSIPDCKLSVYKNRRGGFTNAYLWMSSNRGCCRFDPMFATTWDYDPIPLKDIVSLPKTPGEELEEGGEESV